MRRRRLADRSRTGRARRRSVCTAGAARRARGPRAARRPRAASPRAARHSRNPRAPRARPEHPRARADRAARSADRRARVSRRGGAKSRAAPSWPDGYVFRTALSALAAVARNVDSVKGASGSRAHRGVNPAWQHRLAAPFERVALPRDASGNAARSIARRPRRRTREPVDAHPNHNSETGGGAARPAASR